MRGFFIFILLLLVLTGALLYKRHNSQSQSVVFTDLAPAPIGPYSQAIRAGDWLFVSGQIGLDANGHIDSTSIEQETELCLRHIRHILRAAGSEMDDVVKCSLYLTDIKQFSKVNAVYARYFKNPAPARETIEVKALPKGAHVEISVIAH